MRRAVVDLTSERRIWQVPDRCVAAIRGAFGSGWEVVQVRAPSVSDGDGAGASPEAVTAAEGAEVYFGWGIPPEVARAARETLRWAHSAAGGVGASITPDLKASEATLTNSKGVHAEPMADWAVAAIAFAVRGFHGAVRAAREHRWAKDDFTEGRLPLREFRDTRVGIVGLGAIGRAVARRCHALGMEVAGIRRHPERSRPADVSWVGGPDALSDLAARSDVLVLTAPHTAATRGLVDGEILAALPAGAFVINLARGALLDEAALRVHLEDGRLGGAVLDVFATEPLPRDHPFWEHPRVFVTPHVSSVSDRYWERETDLIVENVERYLDGRPLLNAVDLEAGY